ncbi:hypothetical protein Ga0074812_1479 [Parafrankia irregularis]|uniref:Uncharacterized protein n=1 Tax=Parafrankia irregularis TaxID=795642 RepID=A0A0S4QYP6_9ACTN|nr:hypothetical protein Ga0074812_1479 [Parafrankia irregularis]
MSDSFRTFVPVLRAVDLGVLGTFVLLPPDRIRWRGIQASAQILRSDPSLPPPDNFLHHLVDLAYVLRR